MSAATATIAGNITTKGRPPPAPPCPVIPSVSVIDRSKEVARSTPAPTRPALNLPEIFLALSGLEAERDRITSTPIANGRNASAASEDAQDPGKSTRRTMPRTVTTRIVPITSGVRSLIIRTNKETFVERTLDAIIPQSNQLLPARRGHPVLPARPYADPTSLNKPTNPINPARIASRTNPQPLNKAIQTDPLDLGL